MRHHPLDGEMGFAGVGRTEDGGYVAPGRHGLDFRHGLEIHRDNKGFSGRGIFRAAL
jgi:hypothetical protein